MTNPQPNPYCPPVEIEPSASSQADGLASIIPRQGIEFAGAATPQDRERYLRLDGDLGWAFPFWSVVMVGLISIILVGVGGVRMTPSVLAIVTLLGLGLMVSTRWYRRTLFESANPDWDRAMMGRFTADGIKFHRDGLATRCDWTVIDQITVGDDIMVVQWLLPVGSVWIITPAMLAGLDDWSALTRVGAQWQTRLLSRRDSPTSSDLLRLIRDPNRPPTISPPSDAIQFAGSLTVQDVERLPAGQRRGGRPFRAKFIRLVILFCLIGLAFEFTITLLPQADIWVMLIVAYIAAGLIRGVYHRVRRRPSRGRVHFQRGFVTNEGVTIDFDAIVYSLPWTAAGVLYRDSDMVVFGPKTTSPATSPLRIFLKREMFTDDHVWQEFCNRCEGKFL